MNSSCFGLPKSSCFELFGDGKYGLFFAKKFIWNNLYLVFLSFPWYSKTWKIQLFVQWISLLGNTKQDININGDKSSENVSKLESVEVVLMNCNVVSNDYQQASQVFSTFVPDKRFGKLITISPHSSTMLNTTNNKFMFIEILFRDQKNRPH